MSVTAEMARSTRALPLLAQAFERACQPFALDMADNRRVRVGFAVLSEWRPWLAQAQAMLDDAERARVATLRRAHDRDERSLAYALHRLFLSQALRTVPAAVPLHRDDDGRPCLHGIAAVTSLSHTEDAVAFAFAGNGPLGVDVEPIARATALDEIATRICHPDEYTALPAPPPLRDAALLRTWVRKEAFLKAAGIGLACDMENFAAAEGAVLDTRLADPAAGGRVRLHALRLHPQFEVALAAPPALPPAAQWLSPPALALAGAAPVRRIEEQARRAMSAANANDRRGTG
ncbi:MAG: 4'-phosphopantetheinyl transferase superfamily protein [Pseudoxanthomonas sp.]